MMYNKQRKDWNGETYKVSNRKENKRKCKVDSNLKPGNVQSLYLTVLNSLFMSYKRNVYACPVLLFQIKWEEFSCGCMKDT